MQASPYRGIKRCTLSLCSN